MKIYGYVRVSSRDQNPERQLKVMKEQGVKSRQIYVDYISGKNFDRPAYKLLIRKLKTGDLLIIKSIDRLGRNYDEILKQWRYLTKDRSIDIQVIDMPLLNTTNEVKGLTGVFLSDMVLQILAYLAQSERESIRQRQAEGIAIAKANGVHFGAKRKEMSENSEEIFSAWTSKQISSSEAAGLLGVSLATFYRRCKEKTDIV